MRMTQSAVDYRSTDDERTGLREELPPDPAPTTPVIPEVPTEGWYVPPPPTARAHSSTGTLAGEPVTDPSNPRRTEDAR